jgi:hypothetical protein
VNGQPLARFGLRAAGVAIAVVAAIDPVFTTDAPPTLVIARLASSSTETAEALIRSSAPGSEVIVRPAAGSRLPCAPEEACVIVADGSVDVDLPREMPVPVSVVRVGARGGPNVALTSVTAGQMQHAAGAGSVRVAMTGVGLSSQTTELRVTDGGSLVGSATYQWPSDGNAVVDVPWWPVADGPRALRVEAMPFEKEVWALDNSVTIGVNVSTDPIRVLVFDTRPSWGSTFVRRALEDDPRFRVDHRLGLGPAIVAGTAGGRLDSRTLDAVAVTIVGGPDALSAGDVGLLDRFVRQRGGTLVLLPERAITHPATALLAGKWTQHLEATATDVGPMRASETLRLAAPSPVDVVLATMKDRPVIVSSPSGQGRVVVSGAMDAWRYRDADGGAFDRFWRSLVIESAADSHPLRLDFARSITAPFGSVPFVVRLRQMTLPPDLTMGATATCGRGGAEVIRLWPGAPPGVFHGVAPVDQDACEVTVAVTGGPAVSGGIALVTGGGRSSSEVMAKLERAAERSGGAVVAALSPQSMAPALTFASSQPPRPHTVHPMRSAWWLFPFVACLGLEWWLRRRLGLG